MVLVVEIKQCLPNLTPGCWVYPVNPRLSLGSSHLINYAENSQELPLAAAARTKLNKPGTVETALPARLIPIRFSSHMKGCIF